MNKQKALTIKEAANLLGVCYHTIYTKRHLLGFQLPGGRKWFIWPSSLDNLSKKNNNVFRLSLQVGNESNTLCRSTKNLNLHSGGLISGHQVGKELDALLEPMTKGKRKSTTTR